MRFIFAVIAAVTADEHNYEFTMNENTMSGYSNKDAEAGTYEAWSTSSNGDDEFKRSVATLSEKNEETEEYDTGRIEQIEQVSDYLYYSLDSWGQQNSATDQPQCDTAAMCGGMGIMSSNQCCAAISISEKWSDRENYYIYRCLDKGLVLANLNFEL